MFISPHSRNLANLENRYLHFSRKHLHYFPIFMETIELSKHKTSKTHPSLTSQTHYPNFYGPLSQLSFESRKSHPLEPAFMKSFLERHCLIRIQVTLQISCAEYPEQDAALNGPLTSFALGISSINSSLLDVDASWVCVAQFRHVKTRYICFCTHVTLTNTQDKYVVL